MNRPDIENKFNDILEQAIKYAKEYDVEQSKFPYHLNVITELHDNENAHTRILMKLLDYKDEGGYPLLKSFINRMNVSWDNKISKPSITTEHCIDQGNRRIDGLVVEKEKYAIIIENKIMGACDLDSQIEDYIKYVKNKLVSDINRIFVIYLTKNGDKVVSDRSLTKKTKNILDNHYIPMSFQYDIIPWLEEDVLPNCKVKEKCLSTAVYQYLDYLKDLCSVLDYQKEARKNALNKILNGMEDYKSIKEKLKLVKQFENALQEEVNKLEEPILEEFKEITEKYLGELVGNLKWNDRTNNIDNPYCMFYNSNWKTESLWIHFEWLPLSSDMLFDNKPLNFELHIEGKERENFKKTLLSLDKDKTIELNKKNGRITYNFNKFSIPNNKSFAELTKEERKKYLTEFYPADEIKNLVTLVNSTINLLEKNFKNDFVTGKK